MESLPHEILVKIVRNLPLCSIVQCRLINKKLKSLIDYHIKINELVIGNRWMNRWNWSCHYEPVDNRNKIKQVDFRNLNAQSSMLKNIRRLYIDTIESTNLEKLLKNLQDLTEMEILDVDGFVAIINLPYLTHLRIVDFHTSKIQLNTPNLSHLNVRPNFLKDRMLFNHPQTIRRLVLKRFDFEFVTQLINLEYLYFCLTSDSDATNLLGNLVRLKEIHLDFVFKVYIIHLFESIRLQNQRLNRDVKVFVCGVSLNNTLAPDFLDWIHDDHSSDIRYLCENYTKNLAVPILLAESLYYEKVRDYFAGNIPLNFLSRFPNVDRIMINSRIDDELNLINFLRRLPTVEKFSAMTHQLIDESLSQEFFNNLNHLFFYLHEIQMFGYKDLNLDFIFKIDSLRSLYTNQIVSYDLLCKFLTNTELTNIRVKVFKRRKSPYPIKNDVVRVLRYRCGQWRYCIGRYDDSGLSQFPPFQTKELLLQKIKSDRRFNKKPLDGYPIDTYDYP